MNFKELSKFLLWAILFFMINFGLVNTSFAQKGAYLISNHSPAVNNNHYFDIELSSEGNSYIATKNGIIKYNGNEFSIVDRGGAVLSLTTSQDGIIYAAGVGGFGYINNKDFNDSYSSILDDPSIVITDLLFIKNILYAISDNSLYKYNTETDSIYTFKDDLAGQFYQIFEFNEQVLLLTENKGILEIEKSQLVTTEQRILLDKEVSFIENLPESSKYIIGTFNQGLFIYSEGNIIPLLEGHDFLLNNITCANWYSDDRLILGSTYGGLALVNVSENNILEEINFNSGLTANDVKSVEVDRNGNILSLSDNLIELIALKIPIKAFNHFGGLEGTPQALAYFDDKLFVSTTRGLFSLNKVNNYEQQRIVIPQTPVTRSELVETKRKRKKNRKKKDEIEKEEPIKNKVITKSVVTSSYFQFEKVNDIQHGNQIISSDSSIIVSGLSGVTEITRAGSATISESPTFYTYLSNNKMLMFICGDNSVTTFQRINKSWVELDLLTDFNDDITHIIEKGDNYWLCGTYKIHNLKIVNKELVDVEVYPIHNPYFDAIYGASIEDSIHFFSSNNHYFFKNDTLQREKKYSPHKITIDNNNTLWMNMNGVWQTPNTKHYNPLFSTISSINNIYTDNKNPYFWVLTEGYEILRFDSGQNLENSKYLPYLDALNSNEKIHLAANQFKIEQLNNKLHFKVSHPDLTNLQNTLYRHRLKGLNSTWSGWSKNSEINFSYLPAGKYTLEIESKSAFNQLYQLEPIKFIIEPPYWKQPLFYLFEFMVIVFLLMISMKMRARFRIISKILAFLVLAIIIEGMQEIMESYFDLLSSPLFSFSLQVMTALILFPFEGFLRKYILLQKPFIFKKVLKKIGKQ